MFWRCSSGHIVNMVYVFLNSPLYKLILVHGYDERRNLYQMIEKSTLSKHDIQQYKIWTCAMIQRRRLLKRSAMLTKFCFLFSNLLDISCQCSVVVTFSPKRFLTSEVGIIAFTCQIRRC